MKQIEEIVQGMKRFKWDIKPFCGGAADWERFDRGLARLEKLIPMVPYWYDDWLRCGDCERTLGRYSNRKSVMQRVKCCPRCGREIDWAFYRITRKESEQPQVVSGGEEQNDPGMA